MKKYTKRILAFVLATVMVITGVPMNAKEVKAAEPAPFMLDFTQNISGLNGTKLTAESAGEGWKVHTLGTGSNALTEGSFIELGHATGSGATPVFSFTAPAAATYDMTIAVKSTNGTADADVYVNDIYVGTIKTSTSETADRGLVIPSQNLYDGEYANTIKFVTKAADNATAPGWNGKFYFRLATLSFAVSEVQLPFPDPTEAPATTPEPTEEPVVEQEGFTLEFAKNIKELRVNDKGAYLTENSYGEGWKVHTLGKGSNSVSADKFVDIGGLEATTVFEFTAPEKATYDLTFSFESTNGTADADVYVNDNFAGTVKTSKSETADRGYVIPNVNLYGIEYTNTIKFVVKDAFIETAPDWNGEYKLRLCKIDFVESEVQVPFPDPTPTPTPEATEEPVVTPEPTEEPVVEQEGFTLEFAKNLQGLNGTKLTAESYGDGWKVHTLGKASNSVSVDKFIDIGGLGATTVFAFTAPEKATYDLTFSFESTNGTADADVYVNDAFVGTVKTSKSETADRGYEIPNINLHAIEYANTIKFVVKDASIETAPSWNGEYKLRLSKIDFVESEVQVPFPDPTPAPTPAPTEPPVVEPEGTLHITASNVDRTTIYDTDGKGNYMYFTANTKPTVESGENWAINTEKSHPDTYYDGTEEDVYSATRYYAGNWIVYYYETPLVFDFTVSKECKYNISADIAAYAKGGYAKVFVDDVYVGTVDGYATSSQSVTQNLLSLDLTEGTHTVTMLAFAASNEGGDGRCKFEAVHFVPAEDTSKEITGFTAEMDKTEFEMAVEESAQITSVVSTTDDDVIYFPTYTVSDENVVAVNFKGEVTLLGAGQATITVSVPGKDPVEFTVTVTDSRPRYTVTWMVDDEAIEVDTDVVSGAAVSFDGEAPVKEATAQYTYEFAGWVDAEGNAPVEAVVDADLTYYAVFTETLNSYTVKFVVEGEVVSEEVYEYGTMPVVPEVNGYEEADKIYAFLGWDSEVSAVTGEATYNAVFEEVIQNYTITFADEDGTVLEEITVAPGDVPVWTVTPSKEATAQYTYTFIGWDKEVVPATEETTYTAVYEATVNEYTVTWMNFDGTVLATETYEYGETPEYKGETPVYNNYTFTGWSPEVVAVEGDTTYTAQFEMSGKSIEWFDEDGDGVAETGYYYVDGAVKKGAGLVEVDGYLYWVLSTGKIALGTTRTIRANQTNGLIEAGTYYFLSNGILETAEVRLSGEIRWSEENGKQVGYYYVMNEVRKDVGLVEVWNEEAEETTWFYVLFSGKVKRNYVADGKRVNQTVKANRLNKYTGAEGLYSFYEDGVMYDPYATETGIVKYDETGKPWYYVDGHIRKDAGLVYVTRGDMAGNYIFVTFSGTLKKGTQSIKEKTCNGHTEFIGTQRFDNNTGAMIIK